MEMIYEAAIKGDKDQLLRLVQQNAYILDQVTAVGLEESPLHIAAQFGHVDFVTEILNQRPDYVRHLNSQGQSALHLASKRGYLNVVEVLLQKDKRICFFRDKDGSTPLQLAAIRGRLEVVEKLVGEKPAAAWMLTNDGEPILHLCAKYNQFDAVKKLVELVNDIEFLNMKDSEDNSILHVLAAKNENKVIRHLVGKGLDINTKNVYGTTACDALLENTKGIDSWRTKLFLMKSGAKTERKWFSNRPDGTKPKKVTENYNNMFSEGLLVLAILMATVAFQTGIDPPGGVWQDTGVHNRTTNLPHGGYVISDSKDEPHLAGESVFSYTHSRDYLRFCFFNRVTIALSLILIGLLVLGFKFDKWWSKLTLITITFGSVYSMLRTYQEAMVILSPYNMALIELFFGIKYIIWYANWAMAVQVILGSIFFIFVLPLIPINVWYYFFNCASLCLKFKKKLSCCVAMVIRGSRAEPIP